MWAGQSNTKNYYPTMITNWRNKWKQGNFPFYFVQIAPFKYGGNGTSSAALRDAQRKSLSLPNTGMAVILDANSNYDIHPSNKPAVGERLALWALAKDYNRKEISYSGPLFKSMEVNGSNAILSFEHTDGALHLKGDNGFEMAGVDGNFFPASAVVENNLLKVSSPEVKSPSAVRYAYYDTSSSTLFNASGLPASSFFATADALNSLNHKCLPHWALGEFVRTDVNPVISPRSESTFYDPMRKQQVAWESNDTFNPAAVVKNDSIIVLYRAEDKSGIAIGERTSRIGYAATADGINMVRRETPVLFPAEDNAKEYEWKGGCEDPRVAVTEDGTFVMLYTEWNNKVPRIGAATSTDLIHWKKNGPIFKTAHKGRYLDTASKSASIITKVVNGKLVIAKINGKYWMYWGEHFVNPASSTDLVNWEPMLNENGNLKQLIAPREGFFDSDLTECGPPAVMTDDGIILLYNGKNAGDERRDKKYNANTYTAGQVLFDKNDLTKPIARLDAPFFAPAEPFEKTGQYAAGTVFIEGLALYKEKWYLYYGAADSKVGVAVYDPAKK